MGHLNSRIPAQATLYRLVILAHDMGVSVRKSLNRVATSKFEPILNLKPSLFTEMEKSPLISISCAQPTTPPLRSHLSRYQEPEIEEMVKAAWGTCGSICPKRLYRLLMSQRNQGDSFTRANAPHQLRPCRSPARERDRRRAFARPRDTAHARSRGCAPRACRHPSPPQQRARAGR